MKQFTNKNEIHILYLGRLIARKNVDKIILAFNILCKKLPIFLTIVGDGPEIKNLKNISHSSKINFNEIYINDHFYYPWNINDKAKLEALLLHYKFLPGDIEKYHKFAIDERHWNNSKEYKVYDKTLSENINASFYSKKHSVQIKDLIENMDFLKLN